MTDRPMKNFGRRAMLTLTANSGARRALAACTQRALLPPTIWKRLPVSIRFQVRLHSGNSFWYSSTSKDAIGRALYWRGIEGYEPETLRVFARLARGARFVLDIGANTGVYALLACAVNPAVQVIAFEPVARIRARLLENVRLNGWEHRIEVREEVVTDYTGVAKLHIPAGELPTSSSLDLEGFRGVAGALVDVPSTTVDDAVRNSSLVDLVKIDVEGFEDRVLQGMRVTLERCRPEVIVEMNPDGPYTRAQAILREYEYVYFHLTGRGVIPKELISPDNREKYRNYLCRPQESSRIL